SRRAPAAGKLQSHHRTYTIGIVRRPRQSHAQAGPSARVPEKFRCRAVLCDDQIRPPVMIEVRDGCAALLTVNFDPADRAGHRSKSAFAIAAQEQTSTGIQARVFQMKGKKVLRE